MIFDPILIWPGYGLVGVILGILSTFFAFKANRNAKNASEAAKLAINNFSTIDGISELGQMLNRSRELRLRLENEDYHRVSEGCGDILQAVAKLTSARSIIISDDGNKELSSVKLQVSSLAKMIDRKLHDNGQLDLVKIKTVLNKIEISLAVLQVELKEKVSAHE